MRFNPALVAAVVALATPAVSQEIDAARLSEQVRVLSGDEFEGRGVGTEGETRTTAYLAAQFAAVGFSPGGVDGSWVQPVTLRRFEQSNIVSTLKIGRWSRPLVQGDQLTVSSRLPAERVDVANAPLVFVGYGVTAPERGWDDFKGVDLQGKVAVVLVNDPDFEAPELAIFGGRAMTYYGRWTYKYEELARRGAAGAIIIHETAPASYGWATVKNSWTNPQFDIVRENPAAERLAFEAWIQRDVAVDLFQRVGLDLDALKRQARTREFRPVSLGRARIDVAFDLSTTTIQTNNVIARLEGSARPDETILYTAHWDHLGRGAPDASGDDIFNGALDNATGTGALIEIARAFAAGPRPQRSIVMIGFTAEEGGLLGSEFYAVNPIYPLARTVGGFNMDGLNVFGPMADIGIVGSGLSTLEDDLTAAAQRQGRRVSPDPAPEGGGFFRSDHFPLSKRGVPMLYAGGGSELVDGGTEVAAALRADYTRARYHQVDDEWDPNWNLEGAVQDLTLLYELGANLANSDRWPEWKPGAEFKAARDATAGERP